MNPPVMRPARTDGDRVRAIGWQELAGCVGADPRWFFPPKGQKSARGQEICHTACPVREQCLAYAEATGQAFGIWGGTTPEDRKRRRRANQTARRRRRTAPAPTTTGAAPTADSAAAGVPAAS